MVGAATSCDIGWMQIDKGKPKPGAASSAPTAETPGRNPKRGPCLRQAGLPPVGMTIACCGGARAIG